MPEVDSRRPFWRSRSFVAGIAALLAVLLVIVLALVGRFAPESQNSPSVAPSSEQSEGAEASDGGRAGSAPGERPAVVPYSSVQKLAMTFPDKQYTEQKSFAVHKGETYLLRFDVDAEKPADSPGNGFMLGLSLRCTDSHGRDAATIGGTENLLTGQPVTFTNQVVLAPQEDAVYTCAMLANAPDAELAARGTPFVVDVTWKVTHAVGIAVPAARAAPLPTVTPAKSSQVIFAQDVAIAALTQRQLDVLVSLQLTTCTGPGGSTEDGTQWCTEELIDPTGSHYRFEVRFDVIGEDGQVCGEIEAGRRQEYLDTYRHHQLYHVEKSLTVPADLCGDRIRTSVNLRNDGPAGLLVHRQGSSMVTMETRPVS